MPPLFPPPAPPPSNDPAKALQTTQQHARGGEGKCASLEVRTCFANASYMLEYLLLHRLTIDARNSPIEAPLSTEMLSIWAASRGPCPLKAPAACRSLAPLKSTFPSRTFNAHGCLPQ